ncbi:polysaccharide biosynthesis tyrosine autokinase [Chloroflexota bacterium]
MEIRQYWYLFRKWWWLLVLGGVLGGAAAYLFSMRLPTIFQTTTRVMVSRVSSYDQPDYYSIYGDIQLAKTYQNLFTSSPVLQAISDQLGYQVTQDAIGVKQVPDSSLLDITVSNSEAARSAEIANELVDVFISYNETLQASRYEASEQTFQNQIAQVEAQISRLQDEMAQSNVTSEILLEEEYQQQLSELQAQLITTEAEIINVEADLVLLFPTPIPTSTPETYFSSTPTPIPTPTLSPAAMVDYKETQNRLDKLQTLRNLYKDAYANLLVLGSSSEEENNPPSENRQDQLQTSFFLYQQIYTSLLNNYETVRLARLQNTPNVVQIEPAEVPSKPIQSQPSRNIALGFVSGVLIMGAVAFLIEYLDDTLKTPEDVQRYMNTTVIGMIGELEKPKETKNDDELVGVYVADYPLSVISEGFRTLRTNLDFASVDEPLRTLAITSANPSEGKSTLAVNLAVVMAQGGKRTILLDADLRRPILHRHLKIENREGLSDLFSSEMQVKDVIRTWGNPPIEVITSGPLPPNPTELLSSSRMDTILENLIQRADIVIIDTSPAIVSDPIALSAKVDGVLVIVEPGKTKISSAQVLMEQLGRADANILGVVLNPISRRNSYYYSHYHYYYSKNYYSSGYGYGHSDEE